MNVAVSILNLPSATPPRCMQTMLSYRKNTGYKLSCDILSCVAVGLARSEARAEGLRKAGIEPVVGELSETDILAKAAASGTMP